MAKPGDWMFSAGYHHIDIHSSCWSFLGFHFEGTDYFFKSLPFGLATAPFLFTQLIKQLARKWRAQGIRVIPYVDDILFLCDSEQEARLKSGAVIRDLKESGLVINAKKSHLAATQRLHFLEMELDTASERFSIGQERKAQLTQALRVLLRAYERNQRVSIRLVTRVTGILASMALALGAAARSFSHQLLTIINEAPSWNARVTLTLEVRDELQFWLDHFDRFNRAPFHMPHSLDTVIRALLQPACRTMLPSRAALPNPNCAALPRSPAPPSRPTATNAAAAAAAAARATAAAGGGAAGSARSAAGAGGAVGAGGAGPATDRHCLSWPLSRELVPQRCVNDSLVAAALGASESAAALGASESASALSASESAAALGASEFAAALGARESAAGLRACASPTTCPSSAEALHTFTLDTGASRCFFRDCTALTPHAEPVPVSLADPTRGLVVARASTVLLCPSVPCGSLSGLHLPTFSTNLVSNAAIQDV
ncbi:unnamed protein product [Closterium sp. NIES-54]